MSEQIKYIEGRKLSFELCHDCGTTQDSERYAWGLNSDGNSNNNNKYNGLTALPLSELCNNQPLEAVPFEGFIDAYFSCRSNKRSTINALDFECDWQKKLYALWEDVINRRYSIGKSICFIVNFPVKREVFAADFRDRIIHHWIAIRLEPLFDSYLHDCMMSNRKGKGTTAAQDKVYNDIRKFSENYTRSDLWIYKFDLQGFFMSIDKRILLSKLKCFLSDRYKGTDKDTLLYLCEKVIMHSPQKNCIFKSDKKEWRGLAHNKSLFYQDDFHGLAIGNLTSQMLANFYLKEIIDFLNSKDMLSVTQYVDDFVCLARSKEQIITMIPQLREFLKSELSITLHPRKSYIQHYTKGVKFVGAMLKNGRKYISGRTADRLFGQIRKYLKIKNLNYYDMRSTVNSYLGLMSGFASCNIRRKTAQTLSAGVKNIYFTNHYNSLKFKKI